MFLFAVLLNDASVHHDHWESSSIRESLHETSSSATFLHREMLETELNRTEPNRTEPNRTEPNRTEPNRTGPDRTEPNRTVSF